MADSLKGGVRQHAIRFDNFLEDISGLNIKGLRSIGTTFTNPLDYFTAAKDADWFERYTPSTRLWFSLTAVIFFFKFLWADDDASTIQTIATQMPDNGVQLPVGATFQTAASGYAFWWFAYQPFAALVALFVLGAIWPFWGRKTPVALQARYIYAVVIPSAAFTIRAHSLWHGCQRYISFSITLSRLRWSFSSTQPQPGAAPSWIFPGVSGDQPC